MKKLILIMMVVVSFTTFADESLIQQFVKYADQIAVSESYSGIKESAAACTENFKDYYTVDYLTADVKLEKIVWDSLDKQQKGVLLLSFVVDMYDKTGSVDINVKIDYTTVLMVFCGNVAIERVY